MSLRETHSPMHASQLRPDHAYTEPLNTFTTHNAIGPAKPFDEGEQLLLNQSLSTHNLFSSVPPLPPLPLSRQPSLFLIPAFPKPRRSFPKTCLIVRFNQCAAKRTTQKAFLGFSCPGVLIVCVYSCIWSHGYCTLLSRSFMITRLFSRNPRTFSSVRFNDSYFVWERHIFSVWALSIEDHQCILKPL